MNDPMVFISYSQDDIDWVTSFANALRQQGVDVWLDTWQVRPGEPFADAVETGLRTSDAIVAVLSRASDENSTVLFEIGVALGAGKPFIPIVPSGVDKSVLPFALRARRFLRMGAPDEAAREVAEALRGRAA